MHRKLWLLVGAAVTVLLVAASATATTKTAGSAKGAELAATPFSQSWAFNTNLSCCNQLVGGFLGNLEAIHGAYNQDNKGSGSRIS